MNTQYRKSQLTSHSRDIIPNRNTIQSNIRRSNITNYTMDDGLSNYSGISQLDLTR